MSRHADEEAVLQAVRQLLEAHPPTETEPAKFLQEQFDAGLAWVHFPPGLGGMGLDPTLHEVAKEALHAAGAPTPFDHNPIGIGMAAPTIEAWGTDEQKERLLRPLFTGEEFWCQLFSEPGAGSDLAGLSTRAARDGEEWIVSGQKVWTTLGHKARWGLLIARTDPQVAKHKGLTYFVCDMQADGVDVRPLRQMTGEAEFNEVYLTDVRVPDSARIGPVGAGWSVALTTLMNERIIISAVVEPRGSGRIADAVDAWLALPLQQRDPLRRDRLTKVWIEAELVRLTNLRAMQAGLRGTAGPEGSVVKLMSTECYKRIYEVVMDLVGADGMLYGDYASPESEPRGSSGSLQRAFLQSRANTIEGGTSEVNRNILGERVLGLPGDHRVDKDRPWNEVPRN